MSSLCERSCNCLDTAIGMCIKKQKHHVKQGNGLKNRLIVKNIDLEFGLYVFKYRKFLIYRNVAEKQVSFATHSYLHAFLSWYEFHMFTWLCRCDIFYLAFFNLPSLTGYGDSAWFISSVFIVIPGAIIIPVPVIWSRPVERVAHLNNNKTKRSEKVSTTNKQVGEMEGRVTI